LFRRTLYMVPNGAFLSTTKAPFTE